MAALPVDNLYQWLNGLPTPAAERILGAGLEWAESPYRERLVETLFSRNTEAAWAALATHHDRLNQDELARFFADNSSWRAGVAAATKATRARERARAYALLAEHPCPSLAYLIPDALRDSAEEVRQAAARALRRTAEAVLDDPEAPASARTEVARAVQEALRTYDLHFRPEAVELALWFAVELQDSLWKILANPRSQGSHVVHAHLEDWNGPRLAPFLLQALAQPSWWRTAQEMLQQWHTPEQIAALLRHTEMLEHPDIQRRLAGMKHPRWFDELGVELERLPPELRRYAPQWLCHLGYGLNEKVGRLSRWLEATDPGLQLGAAFGLAALDVPEAVDRLNTHVVGDTPLATFARWYVSGRAETSPAGSPPPASWHPESFSALWQACRTQVAEQDGALIVALRESLDTCRDELLKYLHSPNPGDRLLALRILNNTQHAPAFRDQLEKLLDDPVEPVRRLATALLKALPKKEEPSRSQPLPPPAPPKPQETTRVNQSEPPAVALRRKLHALAASDDDAETLAALARELRDVLRQLPGDAAEILNLSADPQEPQP